ncbi:MAG: hypothetical protein AAF657_15455, partial [Acidobacteriota bacterium]
MTRSFGPGSPASGLSRVLTLFGLGRLAGWLAGGRRRRAPLPGAPFASAFDRVFGIGMVRPLLNLMRLGQRMVQLSDCLWGTEPRQPTANDPRQANPVPSSRPPTGAAPFS